MAILLSTSAPLRFTPEWRQEEEVQPVYLLRAGNIIERELLEAELAGEHRAGRVSQLELRTVFCDGVATLLKDSDAAGQIIELVMQDEGDLDATSRQLLFEAREVIEAHWPEYRALKSQAERRAAILPIVAFRQFCTGWENVEDRDGEPLAFKRAPDGQVSLEAMAKLMPIDVKLAGYKAYNLLYATDQVGNSARPSKSDDGQQTSHSDAPSPGDGKSQDSDGEKTPA